MTARRKGIYVVESNSYGSAYPDRGGIICKGKGGVKLAMKRMKKQGKVGVSYRPADDIEEYEYRNRSEYWYR